MTIVPSTLLGVDVAPTDPGQVWGLSRLFLTSWDASVELENHWDTDILAARTAAEKRLSLSGKPTRALRVTLPAFSSREAWLLLNAVKRMSMARSLMPLYCDSLVVTSITGTGNGTVFHGDARDRRYYVGGRVIIGHRKSTPAGFGPECDVFETATISAVSPVVTGSVTITAATTNLFHAGDLMWPCLEVDVGLQPGGLDLMTDRHSTVSLVCKEVPGTTALPPWQTAADLPLSYATFTIDGVARPVFVPAALDDPETRKVGWTRSIHSYHVGLGDLFELGGVRPQLTRSYSFYPNIRSDSVKVMRFWDACSGPMTPFVALSPMNVFDPMRDVVSVNTGTVVVKAVGPVSDWADYAMIAVKARGAAPQIAAIASVARASGNDTITIVGTITAISLANLQYVTTAHLVRFSDAGLTERWATTEHVALDVTAMELLRELPFTLDLDPGSGLKDTTDPWPPVGCGEDGTCPCVKTVVTVGDADPANNGTFVLTWDLDMWVYDEGGGGRYMTLVYSSGEWIISSNVGDSHPWRKSGSPGCPPDGVYADGDPSRYAIVS